jgi:SagB-type dehydrogenase family enzyme
MTPRKLPAGLRNLAAVAVVAVAGGCASQAPRWVQTSQTRYDAPITLPAPVTHGGMSLDEAIARRRSSRGFRSDPLPLATVGQLLWAGQGITSADGKRAAPSAGALYPLELYVVTPTELMHYLPEGHRVEVRGQPDARPQLRAAAFGQAPLGTAPDVIVVAAVPERTRVKYGSQADGFVEREAGHAAQNVLLEATASGLAAVPIGSLDAARVERALALPSDQTVLYLIPVGLAP